MIQTRLIQLLTLGAFIGVSVCALAMRDELGMKGSPVAAPYVIGCIIASACTAMVAARAWHWLPAPFLAGIVGVFAGGPMGPSGGVLGLAIGAAIVIALHASSSASAAGH